MKKPESAKERGLIKGAMRRIFSRSELRQLVIKKATVNYHDPNRPRVTKWVFCSECGLIFPRYLAEVDHIVPLIPLNQTLDELTWDEVIDRLWCKEDNLACVCKECHKAKSKEENRERRELKKGKKIK